MQTERTEHIPMPTLKALAGTYSGDSLTENRIRGAVRIGGRLYVATDTCGRGTTWLYVGAVELLPRELWKGETATYDVATAERRVGHRSPEEFYKGIVVSFQGKKFVLNGQRIKFVPQAGTVTTATRQLSLFDLQA